MSNLVSIYYFLAHLMDSGWCYEVQRIVAQKWGHGGGHEQPELSILFNRISHLAGLPIAVRFIQDGPERPLEKRGKKVRTVDHFLVKGMRPFAEAYGFEWHVVRSLFFYTSRLLRFSGAW